MCANSQPTEQIPESGIERLNPEIKFYPCYHPVAKKYLQEYPKDFNNYLRIDNIFWVSVVDEEFSDDGYFWMAFTEETGFSRTNTCCSYVCDGKWITAIGMKTYDQYCVVKNNWLTNFLVKFKFLKRFS